MAGRVEHETVGETLDRVGQMLDVLKPLPLRRRIFTRAFWGLGGSLHVKPADLGGGFWLAGALAATWVVIAWVWWVHPTTEYDRWIIGIFWPSWSIFLPSVLWQFVRFWSVALVFVATLTGLVMFLLYLDRRYRDVLEKCTLWELEQAAEQAAKQPEYLASALWPAMRRRGWDLDRLASHLFISRVALLRMALWRLPEWAPTWSLLVDFPDFIFECLEHDIEPKKLADFVKGIEPPDSDGGAGRKMEWDEALSAHQSESQ